MKSFHLTLACLVLSCFLSAQNRQYPVAIPTDQPNVVISPYDDTRRLDVSDLEPGSLAEDPVAKKIFRIPFSSPAGEPSTGRKTNTVVSPLNNPIPPPPTEAGKNASSPLPTDLLNFIYAFNQNSTVNDPDALVPFYAEVVEDYFGRKNLSRASIRVDRSAYINRFPQREYILEGQPELLKQEGNYYDVMAKVKYAVGGNGRNRSGVVNDFFKIRRGARRFEIVGINETKAESALRDTQKQAGSRNAEPTVYGRFELDQVKLFLDAFAASGESDDPSAMVEFVHPQISEFDSMSRPLMSDVLKARREYIRRWPERRYWLTEKPGITRLSSGSWDVVLKMGFEEKNGRESIRGIRVSDLRITHTPEGLKISSIKKNQ